jgi:hypothetical protein
MLVNRAIVYYSDYSIAPIVIWNSLLVNHLAVYQTTTIFQWVQFEVFVQDSLQTTR